MSEDHHSPEYYRTRFKKLITYVGVLLIIGTIVTFAADLVGMFDNFTHAIIFAMTVAIIKATAVVAIFMHLWWDASLKTISITFGCTFVFLVGMMWLTVGSEVDSNKPGGPDNTWKHGTHAPTPEK